MIILRAKNSERGRSFKTRLSAVLCFLQLVLCPAHQEKAAISAQLVGVLTNLCGKTSANFDKPYIPKAVLVQGPAQIPSFLFLLSVAVAFISF